MTIQTKAEIKLWASVLIGAGILATLFLCGRTIRLYTILFLLLGLVVVGEFLFHDFLASLVEKWNP